jgi:hypothetical protein
VAAGGGATGRAALRALLAASTSPDFAAPDNVKHRAGTDYAFAALDAAMSALAAQRHVSQGDL